MSLRLPSSLKNFNLHIEGVGYAGVIEQFVPPKITVQTEEYRGSGLDTPVSLDMGIAAMQASWTMAEWSSDVQNLVGVVGGGTSLTAYGAINDDSSLSAIGVKITMRGQITESDPGTWKAGVKTQHKYTMKLRYLRIETDGNINVEIDIENMKRVINGVDQIEILRDKIKF